VVYQATTARQATMLVRVGGPLADPAYEAEDVSLEDLVLGYMGAAAPSAYNQLTSADPEDGAEPGSGAESAGGAR
jgi:hypothetical protein